MSRRCESENLIALIKTGFDQCRKQCLATIDAVISDSEMFHDLVTNDDRGVAPQLTCGTSLEVTGRCMSQHPRLPLAFTATTPIPLRSAALVMATCSGSPGTAHQHPAIVAHQSKAVQCSGCSFDMHQMRCHVIFTAATASFHMGHCQSTRRAWVRTEAVVTANGSVPPLQGAVATSVQKNKH